MKTKMKKSGITLMEMVVVVAAVALLTMLSMPAIKSLKKSFVSEGATRGMINSALASARAMAAEKRCYVGIRFQKAYKYNGELLAGLNTDDVINADQYMIFIMRERDRQKSGNLDDGFRAVEGVKPIKLPDNFGVMDMKLRTNISNPGDASYDPIGSNSDIQERFQLRDTTTFAIIFSPSGKLVIQELQCRNKDGKTIGAATPSSDTIFNINNYVFAIEVNGKIVKNRAMFLQDDEPGAGLGAEFSRRRFVIYERDKFKPVYEKGTAYDDYLKDLWDKQQIYVNPYTGQLIKNQ